MATGNPFSPRDGRCLCLVDRTSPDTVADILEEYTGFEPARPAWKAGVLPLHKYSVAGVVGFEPTVDTMYLAGVKVQCLTAWRHPYVNK